MWFCASGVNYWLESGPTLWATGSRDGLMQVLHWRLASRKRWTELAAWRLKGWVHPAMSNWAWRPWKGDNQNVFNSSLISRSKKSGKQKSSHVIDCFTTNTIGICCFIHFRHFHVLPVSSSKEIEKMTYIVCAGGLFSRCLHSVCQTCGGRNEVHAMGLGMLDSMVEGKLFRKALYLVAATVSLQNAHLRFNQSIGTSDVQLKGGEVSDEVMRAAPGSWQRKTWCSSQRHSCWPGDDIYGTKKLWQKDATSVYKCVNMVTHCHAVVVDDEMLAKCCKHWTLTYVPPRSRQV